MLNSNTRLLILSPHPDDEILGCGGLMSKINKIGGENHVVVFTYGDAVDVPDIRKQEFEKVMKYMNVSSHKCLYSNQFHLRLDQIPMFNIIQEIEKILRAIRPTICAIPYPSFNQDHRVVYEAAIGALRIPSIIGVNDSINVLIYEYPQIAWNVYSRAFEPNIFIDISDEIGQKLHAFNIYESQMKTQKHAISSSGIQKLASMRGLSISEEYAEAYILKRGIIK